MGNTIRVYESGLDRPVVGCVGMDPGYRGPCGLAVGRFDGTPVAWQGDPMSTVMTRWLGDAVCAACRPGERLVLVAESTAYGARVARMLGMATGAVELLLIDLNAVEPATRVDVAASSWRAALGIRAGRNLKTTHERRVALKLQAVERARDFNPRLEDTDEHAAEALCVWEWYRRWVAA